MNRYDKAFKEEAVRLSDEIGSKKAAEQLGVAYYTLREWRSEEPCTATERISGVDALMHLPIRLRVKSN
ncbi:transposase [Paenibacillus sp. NPDC058071]|uniref:transposase n=1 Tax=Paenibacillus sp. NPDC058071 TaxID=3346326 RepID=UPI0036DAD213